jgi:hypothetical protein
MNRDVNRLMEICAQVSAEKTNEPQYTYTGKIQLDFDQLLSITFSPEQEVAFHTDTIAGIPQKRHEGMISGNWVGRHDLDKGHQIHQSIQKKFQITNTQARLNVQRPGTLCGTHIDKHRTYTTNGNYDYSEVLTENILKGIIFCSDWQCGQVFMTGHQTITNWKQGDTFVFPWYMLHGSANASDKTRHLVMFMGLKNQLTT